MLANDLEVARNPWSRFMGLMGRPRLETGRGLWLEPCGSIHMFFMRFAIDAVFVDRQGRVLRVLENLKPWRISPIVKHARAVIELPAGTVTGIDLAGTVLAREP
ncbi:MAG: DUF192 domain-containing protein [Candidatus Dormibacteria bacterium]